MSQPQPPAEFGPSVLRGAYRAWWARENILRIRAEFEARIAFLEKRNRDGDNNYMQRRGEP